jgi:hypothetical protein
MALSDAFSRHLLKDKRKTTKNVKLTADIRPIFEDVNF